MRAVRDEAQVLPEESLGCSVEIRAACCYHDHHHAPAQLLSAKCKNYCFPWDTFIVFRFHRIHIDDQGLTPTMELYPTFAIVLLVAVIKTNLDHMARGMQKIFF